jgi:hypothetical protein
MTNPIRRRHLALAVAAWCNGCAWAAPPGGSDDARTFRALRVVRGHFDGGRWRDDVDRWQGRKHVAMQNLADQMLRTRATSALLRDALGEPDAVMPPGQPAHGRALAQAQWLGTGTDADAAAATRPHNAALWLYRWRGAHDQLAFAVEHDHVVAAGWLHDWE